MRLLQIDELSKNLSYEFIENTYSKIPWTSIKGMRNLLVHEYSSLDKELVWETITEDIPVLLKFCIVEIEHMNINTK